MAGFSRVATWSAPQLRNLLSIALIAAGLLITASPSSAIDPRSANEEAVSSRPPPSRRAAPDPPAHRVGATPGPWLIDYSTGGAWFIDQTQVQYDNGRARAWITIVYSRNTDGAAYSTILYIFDCTQRQYRMVDGAFYSSDGNALAGASATPSTYAIPGSMADAALTVSCTDFAEWGPGLGLARVPPGLTMFQAARNIFRATAPALSAGFLEGSWTQNNDCSNAVHFFSDGAFTLSGAGSYGAWRLAGDQLTFSVNGQSLTSRVEIVDANRIRTLQTDGSVSILQRC